MDGLGRVHTSDNAVHQFGMDPKISERVTSRECDRRWQMDVPETTSIPSFTWSDDDH